MNIVIVTPQMIIGGAETYILLKSKWLVEHGHSVTVISAGGENVENVDSRVRHVQFKTEISPASFSAQEYQKYLKQLSDHILEAKADVVEVHNTSPVVHVAMGFKYHKTPFLINILNEMSYKHNPFLSEITRRADKCGVIYVLCAQMQKFIEQCIRKKLNAKLIYLPVDGIEAPSEPREDFVLTVGRMAADKQYIFPLIEGFTQLMVEKRLPEHYKLHIVGDGELRKKIESLVEISNLQIGHNAIELFGTLYGDELKEQYRKAKLFVGTGTSLYLAASCALPAIIPGYTPDTVPYGWSIWGENPMDIDTLAIIIAGDRKKSSYADLMEDVLVKNTERYERASKNAKKMFDSNIAVEHIMEEWEKEYRRVSQLDLSECKNMFDIKKMITLYRPLWLLRILIRK